MMEGIEDSWNYVGQRRFVTYANLAPGDYTFKVKASNNHGAWNEKGVSLKITVLPPFWETWWFRISVVFLILASLFLAEALRKHGLTRRLAMKTIVLSGGSGDYPPDPGGNHK